MSNLRPLKLSSVVEETSVSGMLSGYCAVWNKTEIVP